MNTIRQLNTAECAAIDSHLNAREERRIPTTYLEDIKPIRFIIDRWRDQENVEAYNGIPLFREPLHPPGSTHDSESQFTMAQREVAGWESANELIEEAARKEYVDNSGTFGHTGGHPPDVYCDSCRPSLEQQHKDLGLAGECAGRVAPEDEVGTFDIGGRLHYDVADKGPGFEARLKNMEGKAPMSLLSPIFIEGICAALSHGTEKYAPNMWRNDPMTFTAELDSIFRHLFTFLRCEDYDKPPPEGSGLLHLFNAGCRLMFLTERYFTHPELDDRYPAPGLDDEMFQQEMHEGAEAQYDKDAQFPPPIPPHEDPITEAKLDLDGLSRDELYKVISDQAHTLWRQQLLIGGK